MEGGTELPDGLRGAVGPGSVGEEDGGDAGGSVDPEGASGVAEMADGTGAEEGAGGGVRGWSIPAEGAGTAGGGLGGGEEVDRCGVEDVGGGDEFLGEAEEVGDVGEEASVATCALENEGVLVLDLTLEDALAEELVDFGGWDVGALVWGGAVAAGGHAEREEELSGYPGGEVLVGDGFESLGEEDEAVIGVLGVCAGGRFEG